VPLLGHTVRVLHASVNFRSLCLGFFTRMICAKRGSSSCGRSMDGGDDVGSTEELNFPGRRETAICTSSSIVSRRGVGARGGQRARSRVGRGRGRADSVAGASRGIAATERRGRFAAGRVETRVITRVRRVGASVARAVWRPVRFSARAGGGSFFAKRRDVPCRS
jgi:hypothetical protein